MKPIAIAIVLIIAVSNIGLNILLKRAAEPADGYLAALVSWRFAAAFAVGTATALFMLWLYVTRIDLGRAILLMGAMSILAGTLVGVFAYRERLDGVEWALFAAIALLYGYRGWQAFSAG